MPDSPRDIDVAGAQAALEAAGLDGPMVSHTSITDGYSRDEMGRFTGQQQPAPTESAAPTQPAAVPAEPATTQPPAGTDDAPAFTHIADESLTPELLQLKRSLQADYTRKTQEVAPWRQFAQDSGIDSPDQLRDAVTVYSRLQDPQNWPAIHQELSQHLEQYGYSPAAAREAATSQLAGMVPAETQPDFDGNGDYVSPQVVQALQAQQQTINQLQAALQQDQRQRQQAAYEQQVAEGLTRMEMQIRNSNPSYSEQDIEAIYELTGPDGNMFQAQQRYESLVGQRLSAILASKGQAHAVLPQALPGGTGETNVSAPPHEYESSLDPAHARARAHLAALEAAEGGTLA